MIGGWHQSPEKASYFYRLFRLPGQDSFTQINFGNYLSLLILDTSHAHEVTGIQTRFVKSAMRKSKKFPHRFAIYHATAYPSHRKYGKKISRLIRKNWCPLFEKYHLHAAFEHHEHSYKRTPPISNEAIDENGVIYIGDGAWGAAPRSVHSIETTWYLAHAASVQHCVMVSINEEQRLYEAYDVSGKIIDSYKQVIHPYNDTFN
ncbi:MAG: hypothetical protein CMO81_11055 [Waddliaceae bacterium]|nr:hypothetical protein [Waddliaceae bacterium]